MSTLQTPAPDAGTVLKRTLILRHQFTKAIATPPSDFLLEAMKAWSAEDKAAFFERSKAMNDRQIVYLRTSGLWALMSPDEREFAAVTFQDTTPQQHADALWSAEAAGVLMWSLGLVSSMPSYDAQFDETQLKPFPQEDVHTLVSGATLRLPADIARARDVAELWHWRARTTPLQREGGSSRSRDTGPALDHAVRLAARAAHEKGHIAEPIDGDFPAHGKAYKSLNDVEWSRMMSIAVERHRALNWLSGFAPDNLWEETPTNT